MLDTFMRQLNQTLSDNFGEGVVDLPTVTRDVATPKAKDDVSVQAEEDEASPKMPGASETGAAAPLGPLSNAENSVFHPNVWCDGCAG
jgi:hypothetical protein